MRIGIDAPPGWRLERVGDWTIVRSPDKTIRIEATSLVGPAGFDPLVAFERGIAPPAKVEYVQLLDDLTTRDGWPMKLTTLRVTEAGEERQLRLGAVYAMTMWTGTVTARVKSRAVYDTARPQLLEILGSARPHLWSDEPACIAELWQEGER